MEEKDSKDSAIRIRRFRGSSLPREQILIFGELGKSTVETIMSDTHVLNRGVRSPTDVLCRPMSDIEKPCNAPKKA